MCLSGRKCREKVEVLVRESLKTMEFECVGMKKMQKEEEHKLRAGHP